MFDKLFMMVGPVWSTVALAALVFAYFAFVAAQTARYAQQGESKSPRQIWGRLGDRLRERLGSRDRQQTGQPLGSSPFNTP